MNPIRATILTGLVFSIMFAPTVVRAQFGSNLNDISITTPSNFPEPHSDIAVSLDAYTHDTNGARINWYINGIENTEASDNREMRVSVGDLGETQRLVVVVTLTNGQTLRAVRDITATRLDIVVEADTLVPIHYRGRALPSSGSTMRAIAIPVGVSNPKTLSYTWSLNNRVLFGGSQVGKQVADIEMPQGGSPLLSVTVSDRNGIIVMSKTTEIRIAAPIVLFYETNALRGLSRTTLRSPQVLIGEEITVRAEPYYMTRHIFDTKPHIEWDVGGRSVTADQQEITLQKNGLTGSFVVSFHIRNLENLLQGAREEFVLVL